MVLRIVITASHQYLTYHAVAVVSCESQFVEDDTDSDREVGLDLNQHPNDGCIILSVHVVVNGSRSCSGCHKMQSDSHGY